MVTLGLPLDDHVYTCALSACTIAKDLTTGREIHDHITKYHPRANFAVKNALIQLFSECGNLSTAEALFSDKKYKKAFNVVTVAAVMNLYVGKCTSLFLFILS